jgi:regulator of sigma E protease
MIVTLLATALVLGVLIFVHELGHFWAAKALDVEVSRFSIGFGPRLFGFKRGETEYVVAAVPLGGYVKMEGMGDEEGSALLEGRSEPRSPSPRDFDRKPLWARFVIIAAGVTMNFIFAFVAFAVAARAQGVLVPTIEQVTENTPAAAAGLKAGDVIESVDGHRVRSVPEVQQIIAPRPGEKLRIEIRRDGGLVARDVVPDSQHVWNDLARDSVWIGMIGIAFGAGPEAARSLGLGASIAAGARETGRWTSQIVEFLGRLVTGKGSARDLGGPILIGQMSGEAARLGLWPLLKFMAIISVNLAVLNLLPVPVLDGGHMVFLGVEAVRGRAISIEQRVRLTQIGMLFVVALLVWAFANDILRLIGA